MRGGLNPPLFRGNLEQWATQLYEYLTQVNRTDMFQAPTPVVLSHIRPGDGSKAPVDGVLMFQSDGKLPVFSKNGEWVALATGGSAGFVPLNGSTPMIGNLRIDKDHDVFANLGTIPDEVVLSALTDPGEGLIVGLYLKNDGDITMFGEQSEGWQPQGLPSVNSIVTRQRGDARWATYKTRPRFQTDGDPAMEFHQGNADSSSLRLQIDHTNNSAGITPANSSGSFEDAGDSLRFSYGQQAWYVGPDSDHNNSNNRKLLFSSHDGLVRIKNDSQSGNCLYLYRDSVSNSFANLKFGNGENVAFGQRWTFLYNNSDRSLILQRHNASGGYVNNAMSFFDDSVHVQTEDNDTFSVRKSTSRQVLLMGNRSASGGGYIECIGSYSNTAPVIRVNQSFAWRFEVEGNGDVLNSNNSYGSLSDRAVKSNIRDATPKLADLKRLRIRHYNPDHDPEAKHIGVVAQEIEEVFPGLVFYNQEGQKCVKYSLLVPMAVKAIQELSERVERLETIIETLKDRLEDRRKGDEGPQRA